MSDNNNQKQGTDIHYNTKGQAVNTETRTDAVQDKSSPTGDDTSENKSTLKKAEEDNKKQSGSSHKSHKSSGKHAKLGGDKHSFVHPENIAEAQEDEQKVHCDCGETVPVSQINKEQGDGGVAVIGQQAQNVNSTGKASFIINEGDSKKNAAKITVDRSTNPATVIEDGIKSNENLYAHNTAVESAIGRETVVTKTVKVNAEDAEINEANSNIPRDLEAGKHNPSKKSRKD